MKGGEGKGVVEWGSVVALALDSVPLGIRILLKLDRTELTASCDGLPREHSFLCRSSGSQARMAEGREGKGREEGFDCSR